MIFVFLLRFNDWSSLQLCAIKAKTEGTRPQSIRSSFIILSLKNAAKENVMSVNLDDVIQRIESGGVDINSSELNAYDDVSMFPSMSCSRE